MNADSIHADFAKLISRRAIHRQLGISSGAIRMQRRRLATGGNISLDTKLKLLQRSGWRQEELAYTQKDLVAAVRFSLNSGKDAREFGPEYLVEKYLRKKAAQ